MKKIIQKVFIRLFKIAKKEFIIKFFSSIVLRGLLLIIPVLFSEAVNLATKTDYTGAMFFIILSIVITIIYRLCEGWNQKTFYNLYDRLYSYCNSYGLDVTNQNSAFSLSRFTSGQYTNILTTDVDIIAGFFANGIMRIVQVIELIIIYAYFLYLDIFLFLTAIIVSIVVNIFIPRANKKVETYNSSKKTEYDRLTMSVFEYFKNIKEIKGFNIFDKIAPITKKQTKTYLDENAKYNVKYYWNNQFFLLSFEVFRLVSVSYGIYLIMQGHLEIGSLLIIYNYYQKIIDNFSTVLTISVEYTNLKVSIERFYHLVEYSLTDTGVHSQSEKEHITEGRITFKNILYGYKNDPVLKNVSLEINPNSLSVITGKAGTGKTGIFDLLLKLNRQHIGEILIDGYDINDIPDEEYFSKLSLLRKDATLFSMSIKDNFALVESDPNKIADICIKLDIHNKIIKLPNAYDTIVNENDGIPMSLKRMIVIARTILKSPKIMLFDEAFIGLDNEEEDKIMNLLLELKKNHTIVMITHEKNVLKNADQIFVMDRQQVVESGTLSELINRKGKYYTLFEKSGTEI